MQKSEGTVTDFGKGITIARRTVTDPGKAVARARRIITNPGKAVATDRRDCYRLWKGSCS